MGSSDVTNWEQTCQISLNNNTNQQHYLEDGMNDDVIGVDYSCVGLWFRYQKGNEYLKQYWSCKQALLQQLISIFAVRSIHK